LNGERQAVKRRSFGLVGHAPSGAAVRHGATTPCRCCCSTTSLASSGMDPRATHCWRIAARPEADHHHESRLDRRRPRRGNSQPEQRPNHPQPRQVGKRLNVENCSPPLSPSSNPRRRQKARDAQLTQRLPTWNRAPGRARETCLRPDSSGADLTLPQAARPLDHIGSSR